MTNPSHAEMANKTDGIAPPQDVLDQGGAGVIIDPLPDPVKDDEEKNATENNIITDSSPQNFVAVNLSDEISVVAAQYEGFDPSIHAANSDGSPKFKKDGKTYQLKRGRKSNDHIASPLPIASQQNQAPQVSEAQITGSPVDAPKSPVDYTALGKVYAGMFFGATGSLIGPEWFPANADEKRSIETAFTNYAKANGANDLPPGWALVFAVGVYSAARLKHENTQSKFQSLKQKAMLGFAWLKGRMGR